MEKPLLSIIVPVYKVELYIKKCIDSILTQSFRDFELILIDDGSPDECPEICDSYAKQDNRVTVIHKPNGGLQSAWISGFRISRGEYIGFVDSDDWIEPEMFTDMMTTIMTNNADIVQCGFKRIRQNKVSEFSKPEATEVVEKQEIISRLVPQILTFWSYYDELIFPSRCNKLFKRNLINDNIQYCDSRISMGEDLNITLPALLDAQRIVCLDKSYYYYRDNENSITQGYKENYWSQNLLLFAAISEIAKRKNVEISEYINSYFNYLTISAIYNESKTNQSYFNEMKTIYKISQENPGHSSLSTFKSSNLDLTSKTIYHLLRFKLIFAIPVLLWLRNIIKKYAI